MVWGIGSQHRKLFALVCLILLGMADTAHSAVERLDCSTIVGEEADRDLRSIKARLIASDVNMARTLLHLKRLTGEVPLLLDYKTPDRYTKAHKELIRLYLIQYLRSLHHSVQFERFDKGMNLIVEIPGTESPDDVLEVTAHYDTVDPDVPGADDNGSGLAALLEFANLFRKHKPKKTLRIVFMDLEESDFEGSKHHAEKLREEFFPKQMLGKEDARKKRFLGSLVIDTIGFNPKGPDHAEHMAVLEVGTPSDFGRSFLGSTPGGESAYAMSLLCAKDICHQFARFGDGTYRRNYAIGEKNETLKLHVDLATAKPSTADHGSFWKEELPAWLLAAPYRKPYINPGYHKSSDTIDNMNWDYYTQMLQFSVEILAVLTEADPAFADTTQTREALALVLAQENRQVTRELDLVKALESPPSPKKKDRHIREVKSNGALVFEAKSDRGDIITTEGDDIFISSTSELKEITRQAARDKRPMLRKVGPGVVTRGDADELALWLIDYLGTPEKPLKVPLGYELLTKAPYEEPVEQKEEKVSRWWNW